MNNKCPLCGSPLTMIPGLDGTFCTNNDCIYHTNEEMVLPAKTPYKYDEDRLKKIRGVPHHSLTIGSETRGRLSVSIPSDATLDESKAIIDQGIEMLKYAQMRIKEENLDIFTTRGKKND